jgi:hypothetical protein
MKPVVLILLFLVGAVVAWQLWFTLSIGIREPYFKHVEKKEGYELRTYVPFVIAEVVEQGSYAEAVKKGFKVLASYADGCNSANKRMPMLAPVLIEDGACTNCHRIAFVMPFEYTLETLPKPRNECIHSVLEPKKVVAATRFYGLATEKLVAEKQREFVAALGRDGVRMHSKIRLARYHPPFILPHFMRNELLVDIEVEV